MHGILREQILDLSLAPGSPLSETELATKHGVSRTPVRESLILLAEEGLVDVVPQVGTFVSPIRQDDIASAQFVREALERASLVDGAGGLSVADLRELRAMIAAQQDAQAHQDGDTFLHQDERFHARLMEMAGHAHAVPIVAQATARLHRARRLSLTLTQQVDVLIEQHRSVIDRLANADITGADAALRGHLRLVFTDIAKIRAEHPEMFDDAGGASPVSRRWWSA